MGSVQDCLFYSHEETILFHGSLDIGLAHASGAYHIVWLHQPRGVHTSPNAHYARHRPVSSSLPQAGENQE